jgi:putative membrane protein
VREILILYKKRMINYNPKSWIKLIFAFHKADTFRILWKEILYIGLFTLGVAWVELHYFPNAVVLEKLIAVYSLIGFVISLLLVFRTNTAYDRWWEGRKKWGDVVNDSRNLSIKLSGVVATADDRDFFSRMIPNFAFSMKEQLRTGVALDELELKEVERAFLESRAHIPMSIIQLMYGRVRSLRHEKTIEEADLIAIDRCLNSLMDCMGACERIRNTPIPFSYSLFLKKFIFIYVTTLPLAFVNIFGYAAALIATFVFYVLVSMEVLAEEIEDPFGIDDNDLPTDQIAEKIKQHCREIMSAKEAV